MAGCSVRAKRGSAPRQPLTEPDFAVPSARFQFPREAKSDTALCGGHPHLVPRTRQAQLLSTRQAWWQFPPLIEPVPSRHSAAAASTEGPQRSACSDRRAPSRAACGQGEHLLPPDSDCVIPSASLCLSRGEPKRVTQHFVEATPTRCPARAKCRCSVREQLRTFMY